MGDAQHSPQSKFMNMSRSGWRQLRTWKVRVCSLMTIDAAGDVISIARCDSSAVSARAGQRDIAG
jgi:hypothetical protein